MTTICLPQHDDDKDGRAREVAHIARAYAWDHSLGMPHVKSLPEGEQFVPWYQLDGVLLLIRSKIAEMAALPRVLMHPMRDESDYVMLFERMRPPSILEAWSRGEHDAIFAEQRVAGSNPGVIHRVGEEGLPPELAVRDDHLRRALGDPTATLRRAIGEARLYLADYAGLPPMEGGRYWIWRKHLPRPRALFHRSDKGPLQPVAIQITAVPVRGQDVVTPADGIAWKIARLCVQTADANHHEMCTHLGRTHMAMGRFAIATARTLSPRHPVGVMLRPHFKYLLALNDLGKTSLLGPGRYTDDLLAGTLDESKGLLLRAFREWHLFESCLQDDLERRGVDDPQTLPHYPYRDDGKKVWHAVSRYVDAIVTRFYGATDQEIADDDELQAWARELAGPGMLPSMPVPIRDGHTLRRILTHVIFTCGPQHSAINYAQYEYGAFAPNMPLALYGVPNLRGRLTERDYLSLLPPRLQAMKQMEILTILAGPRLDRLGFYSERLGDEAMEKALTRFQLRLVAVENEIERKNTERPYRYVHMLPSRISNSTSA